MEGGTVFFLGGVVQPVEKHWESVLRRFAQHKMNNGESTAGLLRSAAKPAMLTMSHYTVPSPVKNPPPSAMRPFFKIL